MLEQQDDMDSAHILQATSPHCVQHVCDIVRRHVHERQMYVLQDIPIARDGGMQQLKDDCFVLLCMKKVPRAQMEEYLQVFDEQNTGKLPVSPIHLIELGLAGKSSCVNCASE